MIEVIVPAARGNLAERLVWSLSRQTMVPDRISLIGNEATTIDSYGLDVRLVRYKTERYDGPGDVCLRRNIGIFFSEADILIFQDDDQMAPPNMVESAMAIIERDDYVWGHHRYIDFGDDPMAIVDLPPEEGHPRESRVNTCHMWQSCYAGMFGAKRDLLLMLGGFDMAFHGRIGNEDQQLGRRLLFQLYNSNSVVIYEPPFAWHPTEIASVERPEVEPEGYDHERVMSSPVPVVPFDPDLVEITTEVQF